MRQEIISRQRGVYQLWGYPDPIHKPTDEWICEHRVFGPSDRNGVGLGDKWFWIINDEWVYSE